MRHFTELGREEIRRMFKLDDIRKSRVWQEAHEEGKEEGREEGKEQGKEQGKVLVKQQFVHRLRAKGKSLKEIADQLEIPLAEVRRLARR